jgi:anthranilate synthase/aminodeoxychorismate synthase-like glutamine amidotransferase
VNILLLDNYDSFTYNLYHYLLVGGVDVTVVRNDAFRPEQLNMQKFDAAVLSPGPGVPQDAGELMQFVSAHAGNKPLLGVCLGMQAIGLHFGWELTTAKLPKHGKSSMVNHDSQGIFKDIPNPMQVGRYHSLIIKNPKEGSVLKTTAVCEDEVMAISGMDGKIQAVQFHPESILTPQGQQLINNWIHLASEMI